MSRPITFRPANQFALLALLLGMSLAAASLAGCQNTIKISDNDLAQIEYRQLNELLTSTPEGEVVLLDVRKQDKYNDGYIPGAINIFLPDLTAYEPKLAKAKQIIVYSGGWDDALSRAAGKRLLALGYTGVKDFRGGTEVWKSEGRMLAVVRETPKAEDQPKD